eukprot:TRINITY_DN15979_c0_g1_i1.p1 TRINITY_DN15979_c0_g1~~TRINITY_DN15979_c0_g1_i1.p1  ORF type:complete len:1148 (+),score=211.02 TRINITY_DN15979_c0_g1_i1:293-3445(+)
MSNMQKDEVHCPLLTFHGTSSVDTVNSILKHGYVLPGDRHPVLGDMNYAQHGSYYGVGVYTSTKKEMSALYNTCDSEGSTYLVLNIVMLGNIEWLEPGKEGEVIPNSLYCYEGGINTRSLPDLGQVISADPKRVFPIGYVCIRARNWPTHYFNKHINGNSGTLTRHGRYYDAYEELPVIDAKLIAKNYYLLLPKEKEKEKEKKTVSYTTTHHVVLSGSFLKSNVKAFSDFISRVNEKSKFYIYGEKATTVFEPKNASHLQSSMASFGSSKMTNPLIGLDTAMDDCDQDGTHVVYLFVDNAMKKRETTNFVNKWHPIISHAKVHLKLIFESDDYDNSWFELKTLDTLLSSWSDYFRYHTTSDNDYVNTILDSNIRVQLSNTTYEIPMPDGVFGEGFLHDLTANPSWSTTTNSVMILKDSKALKVLKIDHQLTRIQYNEDQNWSNKEIDTLFNCLSGILSKLRLFSLTDRARYIKYMPVLSVFCNKVTDIINARPDKFSTLKTMHYLIAQYVNEFAMMSKLPFKGRLFEKFQSTKHGKSIVRRTKEIDMPKIQKELGKNAENLEDLFPLLDEVKGIGVLTLDSEASKIEPWNLMVGYVSPDTFSLADVYKNKELGTKLADGENKKINNIIITSNITPELRKAYLAYFFTGNPYLFIPTQGAALFTNVFVHILEDVLLQAAQGFNYRIEEKLSFAATLLSKIKANKALSETLIENASHVEAYLTEKHDMTSTNMVVSLFRDSEIYPKLATKRFIYAYLCEGVMRACKTYCKVLRTNRNEIFDKFINESGLDLAKAKNVSGKFFQRRYASNSPFSNVSVLEYFDRVHNGMTIPEIAKLYKDRDISMKNFLKKYYREDEATTVQVALFLQGLLFNKSSLRLEMPEFNPEAIIASAVQKHLDHKKLVEKLAAAKESAKSQRQAVLVERRMRKMEALQDCVDGHEGWPEVFKPEEVASMNAKRSAKDKLKRNRNGLLANACCFKACPHYLEVMTEKAVRDHINHIHVYLRKDYLKVHDNSLAMSKTASCRSNLHEGIRSLTRDDAEAAHLAEFYFRE